MVLPVCRTSRPPSRVSTGGMTADVHGTAASCDACVGIIMCVQDAAAVNMSTPPIAGKAGKTMPASPTVPAGIASTTASRRHRRVSGDGATVTGTSPLTVGPLAVPHTSIGVTNAGLTTPPRPGTASHSGFAGTPPSPSLALASAVSYTRSSCRAADAPSPRVRIPSSLLINRVGCCACRLAVGFFRLQTWALVGKPDTSR